MSSVVISGDSSGTVTLTVPSAAGTNTATLPAATGTVMVSGNQPAFSAYGTTDQVISANTDTKVVLNNEHFDTAGAFDSTTNYRFTPQVAGYYQFSGEVECYSTTTLGILEIKIYKNGTEYSRNTIGSVSGVEAFMSTNRLIYLNGTTDYIELYARCSSAGTITLYGSAVYKYLTGVLVRAA